MTVMRNGPGRARLTLRAADDLVDVYEPDVLAVMAADATAVGSRPALRLDEWWTAVRVGKKAAGALLDGICWQQIPGQATAADNGPIIGDAPAAGPGTTTPLPQRQRR